MLTNFACELQIQHTRLGKVRKESGADVWASLK